MSLEIKKRYISITRTFTNAEGTTVIIPNILYYCADMWMEENENTSQTMLCFRTYRADGTMFGTFKFPEYEVTKLSLRPFKPRHSDVVKDDSKSDEEQLDRLSQRHDW